MIGPMLNQLALNDVIEACEIPTGVTPEVVRLTDGSEVRLRDATPADADGLRRMFFQLGDTTRYRYFFVGAPSTPDWAERVVALGVADGARSYALVAELGVESGGDLVGVARFDRNDDGASAEIGGLLVDAWQSRGLGKHVIARLHLVARVWGITAITAHVLGENDRALRLVRREFPGAQTHWEQGVYDVRIALAPTPAPSPVPGEGKTTASNSNTYRTPIPRTERGEVVR